MPYAKGTLEFNHFSVVGMYMVIYLSIYFHLEKSVFSLNDLDMQRTRTIGTNLDRGPPKDHLREIII